MNISLRIIAFVAGLFVFVGIFNSLLKKKMNESMSLVWIIIGIMALLAGIFAEQVQELARFMGFESPPSFIYITLLVFLLLITYNHSGHITKQNLEIKELAIQLSLMKDENEKLLKERELKK